MCGVDGQTYLNKCEADKANVEILHEDHCGCLPNTTKACCEFSNNIGIVCLRTSEAPMLPAACGVDGNTYSLTTFSSVNNLILVPNSIGSEAKCCIGNLQCKGACPCPCPDVHIFASLWRKWFDISELLLRQSRWCPDSV